MTTATDTIKYKFDRAVEQLTNRDVFHDINFFKALYITMFGTFPNMICLDTDGIYLNKNASIRCYEEDEDDEEEDAIDTNKLISIAGESKPFYVEIIPTDIDEYDYSFSAEFIGQETSKEGEIAVINATMGKDISVCKFLVVADTEEETLEAIAEYIASTESEEFYTLNESAELRLPLTAGKFGIVFVLYDVDGEPLDEYYTCIFDLTTGVEDIEAGESGISIDWNSNVISVAGEGAIELLDASGRLVKKANGNSISIADLEKGIYIVKHNSKVVKVVKR